jgi:hypothetical protein
MADTIVQLLKHGIPVGATIRAYPQAKVDEVRRRGDAPSGTPVDTDVTSATGVITLQLTPGIPYWLHASVSGRNVYVGCVGQ